MDAIDTLESLSRVLQNPAKLERAGGMAAEMIRSHIRAAPGWGPLAPATVAYRGAGKPLQDTGGLRDSITFTVVNNRTVSVGTNKPYARLQDNGGVIRAKKNWLWIPGQGTRQLQRRYGYSPTAVLRGLKADGFSVFRKGRTMCYRQKGGKKNKTKVAYYLKKSVEIPARPFFYLTEEETALLMEEVGLELEQL
ncbi:MAG: phage virion morphogenesis protein [Treponema sp.]|jgi:phage gpG-like protein|nr:phage virion morphogenesis protein [Treponema sp.]